MNLRILGFNRAILHASGAEAPESELGPLPQVSEPAAQLATILQEPLESSSASFAGSACWAPATRAWRASTPCRLACRAWCCTWTPR